MQNNTPTSEQFGAYEKIFAYFNERLFGGELPPVVLNFSRRAKAYGFFAADRWQKGDALAHEISLNPEYLLERPARHSLSTIVHEMVHLRQQVQGKPSRTGYHNSEWAAMMEEVGLAPSSTAAPGGKRTGQKVSHYIVEGGPYDRAFKEIPEECLLPWACCKETEKPKRAPTRAKYSCPGCGVNAWAKPGIALICGECDSALDGEPIAGSSA